VVPTEHHTTPHTTQENAMYHPMLTFAVAQTRIDDLNRELEHRSRRRQARSTSEVFDASAHRAGLAERLSRYAARRTRPSAA
jgi:hypothetical protein